MAYYDLKTNEIWAESNIDGFHDEHIEIDEVIAPLIRELNIKGYKTKFCCSGHRCDPHRQIPHSQPYHL